MASCESSLRSSLAVTVVRVPRVCKARLMMSTSVVMAASYYQPCLHLLRVVAVVRPVDTGRLGIVDVLRADRR